MGFPWHVHIVAQEIEDKHEDNLHAIVELAKGLGLGTELGAFSTSGKTGGLGRSPV
jgi:hypothetical protein